GVQMGGMGGQMPDGGGSFYMGDEGQPQDQQQDQQQNQQNPELVFVDQAEVDRRSQGRQYLEGLITGKDSFWSDPWQMTPSENMRTRGRKDLGNGSNKGRRQLLINA
ncbi:MAG: hypothetical protein SFU25_07265, partial [Candidatus Caenarcaniphilales bacterium]|nr:hypothetical protein [Candidatus Caenarcaniphilales bacterium]